jgi:hypothetical protein
MPNPDPVTIELDTLHLGISLDGSYDRYQLSLYTDLIHMTREIVVCRSHQHLFKLRIDASGEEKREYLQEFFKVKSVSSPRQVIDMSDCRYAVEFLGGVKPR